MTGERRDQSFEVAAEMSAATTVLTRGNRFDVELRRRLQRVGLGFRHVCDARQDRMHSPAPTL